MVLPRGWAQVEVGWARRAGADALRSGVMIGLPHCVASVGLELGAGPVEAGLLCGVYDREPPRTSMGVGGFGRVDGMGRQGWSGARVALRQQLGPTAWTWTVDVGPVAGADLAPRLGALGRLDAVWHLGPLAMTGEITLTRGVPTDPPLRWGLGGVILFSRGLEIGAGGGAAGSARAAEVWLRVRR